MTKGKVSNANNVKIVIMAAITPQHIHAASMFSALDARKVAR